MKMAASDVGAAARCFGSDQGRDPDFSYIGVRPHVLECHCTKEELPRMGRRVAHWCNEEAGTRRAFKKQTASYPNFSKTLKADLACSMPPSCATSFFAASKD
jgi:hypothetical protein